MKKYVANWGNYPSIQATVSEFAYKTKLHATLQQLEHTIVRGNGRSYGDAGLAPHIISSLAYNKFLHFDEQNGIIQCQSGVLLAEILQVIVCKGWFLAVTPGTKFITVGGAIAADVHGKNHHGAGTFSQYVANFSLMLASGEIVHCSREQNQELFWATCGGMGLTGIILHATLKLQPIASAYIRQQSIKAQNLDEVLELLQNSHSWTYNVAWFDCIASGKHLGRSMLLRGEHATVAELGKTALAERPLKLLPKRTLTIPCYLPPFVLNKYSVKAFNTWYYYRQWSQMATTIVDYETFFYPLDAIHNWNRIYGRRGFTQYQFVLPKDGGRDGIVRILEKIVASSMGSFLAVLKLFGPHRGMMSFPMEGYTLALDFAINKRLFPLLAEIDKIVMAYNGRIYLAKDAIMEREMFLHTYPQAQNFIRFLKEIPVHKFRSLQSQRLGIHQ